MCCIKEKLHLRSHVLELAQIVETLVETETF